MTLIEAKAKLFDLCADLEYYKLAPYYREDGSIPHKLINKEYNNYIAATNVSVYRDSSLDDFFISIIMLSDRPGHIMDNILAINIACNEKCDDRDKHYMEKKIASEEGSIIKAVRESLDLPLDIYINYFGEEGFNINGIYWFEKRILPYAEYLLI